MTKNIANQEGAQQEQNAAAEPWNLVADGYVEVIMPMSEHFAREALRLSYLPPSAHIVDVAAGPGPLTIIAAKEGKTVSAIDFSPNMVANLRKRAEKAGVDVADLRVGNGQNLPYKDNSFDGGFSLLGLVFFPDRAAGFRELYRVLRPGRRAVVSSMASLSAPFLEGVKVINAELDEFQLPAGEPPLNDPEVFQIEMSAAGFQQVEVHTVEYSETTPSTVEFWEKLQKGAAFVTQIRSKLGEERWSLVSQRICDQLIETFGEGPIHEVYTNYMGVGTKPILNFK